MRYTPEHKQKTRERLIRETCTAIRENGTGEVGVADVMARAGLTHGGFYAHFKSRDELLAAAVDQMFADSANTLRKMTADVTPGRGLATYIGWYLSERHRDARTLGCPLPVLATDLPKLETCVRERYAMGVAQVTDLLAGLLQARGDTQAREAAASLLAELVGALLMGRALGQTAASLSMLNASRAQIKWRLGLTDEEFSDG